MRAAETETPVESQSLKDQGKSRTTEGDKYVINSSRNPLKIRASLGRGSALTLEEAKSQSLKDQGKSRTEATFEVDPHHVAIP